MRNAIVRKLKSNSGTTMVLALLFFLICIVFAMSILIAGTAAAGRASRIAETDARFYSISSAADLLAEQLDGAAVTVVRSKITDKTTVTPLTVAADGKVSRGESSVTEKTVYASSMDAGSGARNVERKLSLVTDLAADLVFGAGSNDFASAAAWSLEVPVLSGEQTRSLTLTHGGDYAETLSVTVDAVLKTDGTLELTVCGTTADTDSYRMKIVFSADMSNKTDRQQTTDQKDVVKNTETDYTETVQGTVTEKKITGITWTLREMKMVEANEDD